MAEKKYLVDLNVEGGSISVVEGQKIILDKDGDSFANFYVNTSNSNSIYEAINEHHFINGDGGAFEAVKAGSFIKDGGTSSQFLKADGTIDSTEYTGAPTIHSVASVAAMVALTTTKGDIVVRTDESKTYMDNGGDLLGSELLSNGDFSSIAFPWNYGTWSYIPNPSVSGGIATLTIDGGSYPAQNPRIEQSFTTTSGEDYLIEVTGDGNGNDIQVLAVDPNNGFAFLDAVDITSNGSYTTASMTVTATSANIAIQILVKGSDGDIAYLSNATAKEVDATAKYTHFASI